VGKARLEEKPGTEPPPANRKAKKARAKQQTT
jgi:hypothetical protein